MVNDRVCGIYIIADETNQVIYTGMSTQLPQRIQTHKDGLVEGFAKKYNCKKLVYYEFHPDFETTYFRERQIKSYSRYKKLQLITSLNPTWSDLFDQLITLAVGY